MAVFTVQKDNIYEESIRKSRFICSIGYATDIEEAKSFIVKVSDLHKTATHNCWAYIVGLKGETFHYSDAGEPPGTAGKPIFGALQKHNTSNIAAVVTRYYGGTKLGIRGLIDAYSYITDECLKRARLIEIVLKDFYLVTTSYPNIEKLKYLLVEEGFELLSLDYKEEITLVVSVESALQKGDYLNSLQDSGILSHKFLKSDLTFE